jgi:hypothetical protein
MFLNQSHCQRGRNIRYAEPKATECPACLHCGNELKVNCVSRNRSWTQPPGLKMMGNLRYHVGPHFGFRDVGHVVCVGGG